MTDRRNLDGGRRTAGRAGVISGLCAAVVLAAGCSSPPTVRPAPPPTPGQLTIWLTGYSWQDNTPPGSSIVGEPVLHHEAGGTGTFADPITVATPGHQGDQEWPPGTKFYLPTVARYVIVEDSGAAKRPPGTDTHLDMWIGGQDGTKQATDDCADAFTGRVPARLNPPDHLPVMPGSIFGAGKCNIPPQPPDRGTYDDPGAGDSDGSDTSDSDDPDGGH